MSDDSHLKDPGKLARWRRGTLDKGLELARKLEQLMNGLDVRLDELGPGMKEKPEREKIRKLRAYLDRVDRVIKSFDAGGFGRCRTCGQVIDELALDEAPWRDACARCWSAELGTR